MSQRLPTPGGDSGTWGDVLNAYLGVSLASDGTLNALSVPASALSSVASGTTATSGWVATADGSGGVTYAAGASGADKLGLTPTAVKTSAYTAVAGDFVPVDTTSAGVTITLPSAPANGSVVAVKHVIQGSTNTVTVATAGSDVYNKASGATSATLTLLAQGLLLQYKTSGAIWYVIADDLPLSQLDTRYAASTFAVDTIGSGTDITTNNASTSKHGLLPKLDSSAAKVLLGDGTWGYGQLFATNSQPAAYTAVLGDAGKIVEFTGSSAATFTIPANTSVAFPVGTFIGGIQYGSGQITVSAASGATIVSPASHVKTNTQYSSFALRKQATDNWVLAGDLA